MRSPPLATTKKTSFKKMGDGVNHPHKRTGGD